MAYWYMLYTIENTTGREVEFYPAVEVVTDTLQVVKSERGVSPEAYQAVAQAAAIAVQDAADHLRNMSAISSTATGVACGGRVNPPAVRARYAGPAGSGARH